MMLKAVFASVFLTGLNVLAFQAHAGEACPVADTYIKSANVIADRDLATAILCVAETLPDEGKPSGPDASHALGQIQQLAVKIIGNGYRGPKQLADLTFSMGEEPETLVTLTSPADATVVSKPDRVLSENIWDAAAISCEAAGMLEIAKPGGSRYPGLGTCAAPAGGKGAIKQYAAKIIGNG